ncbi:molecular chaperone [Morganella morganii]|uniref:fimbrial biogenesis chaperone n=1 Tax=Morganella morganii TaxID=582 RepID=UPI001BDA4089|nr:molecular chaperone [Morganella morganii]EKU4001377.1 molecular chaperone [Morganella morganii]MBT0373171.1 molecular chaperone [Morganella morganii subsp. morganii]MBT0405392.1 molecular chaperone [Morganella morganii subsp. morganii]MBT0424572.1 molecular chaperone [Morganella morganii subsp. morganii]MBT0471445.1 molecular chaperone [Morganella morganii subsp. morganii]
MKSYLLFIGCFISAFAFADGISTNSTRYIYPEDAKDITVRVNNESASPVFVQYWLDAGDSETLPATPFELTPPVSRINPGAEQILRIRLTDKNSMPSDRESLWWLNVLDIPPVSETSSLKEKNSGQLAVRSRFKVFYRPAGLSDRNTATQQVSFQSGSHSIRVNNTSPYHITITEITLADKKQILHKSFMLQPKSSSEIAVKRAVKRGDHLTVSNINDQGGNVTFTATAE